MTHAAGARAAQQRARPIAGSLKRDGHRPATSAGGWVGGAARRAKEEASHQEPELQPPEPAIEAAVERAVVEEEAPQRQVEAATITKQLRFWASHIL